MRQSEKSIKNIMSPKKIIKKLPKTDNELNQMELLPAIKHPSPTAGRDTKINTKL